MSNLLHDVNGNLSSKRVAGYFGLSVAFALTVIALFFDDQGNAVSMLYAWLGFAAGALGLGVFEKKQM